MSNVERPQIVLGVTGSIAAYKAADLTSKLTSAGYGVHVIMTANAQHFVTPQTFLTLSRNPVTTDLWDVPTWKPEHIELALIANLLVIAPATANILAKMANGIADDALSTYFLSHTGPIIVAPAMNPRMWRNPATQENVRKLLKRGVTFAGPVSGRVACGDDGEGRMIEVPEIITCLKEVLANK